MPAARTAMRNYLQLPGFGGLLFAVCCLLSGNVRLLRYCQVCLQLEAAS